jgi:hypothetical protein
VFSPPALRFLPQLVIEISPLLRGEREDISLLDDQTRTRLEAVAENLDEYNARIETALTGPEATFVEAETQTADQIEL